MAFSFNGQGTLLRIDTFTSQKGKTFLTLIMEIQGKYPVLVPIKVFGHLADDRCKWTPGVTLEIYGRLGGRDWQGKVFGDIVAESVEVVENSTNRTARPDDSEMPF